MMWSLECTTFFNILAFQRYTKHSAACLHDKQLRSMHSTVCDLFPMIIRLYFSFSCRGWVGCSSAHCDRGGAEECAGECTSAGGTVGRGGDGGSLYSCPQCNRFVTWQGDVRLRHACQVNAGHFGASLPTVYCCQL